LFPHLPVQALPSIIHNILTKTSSKPSATPLATDQAMENYDADAGMANAGSEFEVGSEFSAGAEEIAAVDTQNSANATEGFAAYAETVGAGPLEPYMNDPEVEEIDVNSHLVTWVSYSDGRKEHVGQLWESTDELHAFQRRLTLSMGVAESRLDEQSPMVTLQAPDGSRVVLVLGGRGRSGSGRGGRFVWRSVTR
jgi:hypothetical protein